MAARSVAGNIQVGEITNFSGGPNFRDSPTELAATEVYGAYNATFDERGGVASRLGYIKRNSSPLTAISYALAVLFYRPALYWRLGDAVASATAADASGNGRTGTVGSGVTFGQSGAPISDTDTAALFDDSVNATIKSSYQPYAIGSQRTFMGWANRLATTSEDPLFGDPGSNGSLSPYCSISQATETVTFHPGTGSAVTWTAAWPGTGQWVHWALTFDASARTAELFINGTSQGAKAVSGTYAGNSTFWAGSRAAISGASPITFNGDLDEIAVYESVLSASAISAIYAARNTPPGGSTPIVNDYYSPLLGITLTQSGTGLYRADNTSAVHTFSTAACVTFTDFDTYVVAGHPADGIYYSSDGTTWTHLTASNAPATANCITTWQGKLFVGLADGTVHWSNLGDITTWTSSDFNAIWTKDQQPIVALHIGSGQDIQGRPGLLVFKQDSVYRINSSATGAYTVIDETYGAAGPKAVVGIGSRVCWIGKHGIFWWREDQAQAVNASDLERPVWRTEQLSYANQLGWAAGRRLNRGYFSCSSVNSAVNDLAFEFHPDEGWIAPRSDAMTCYSTSKGNVEQTYGGSPTIPGQVYQLDTGGTDDGANITGFFQTRWVVPNGGFQAQVWQVRLHGRGSGTMTVRKDYEDSGGSQYAFALTAAGGFNYDNGVLYNSGAVYATPTLAETQAVSGLGSCRQFSLRFDFTVDTTASGRQLFGALLPATLGAFGLYGIEVMHIPLGTS